MPPGSARPHNHGLTGTRYDDMRHTSAALLLHLGVAPDMAGEIVGHRDIEVTMMIYAQTSLNEKSQPWARKPQARGRRVAPQRSA